MDTLSIVLLVILIITIISFVFIYFFKNIKNKTQNNLDSNNNSENQQPIISSIQTQLNQIVNDLKNIENNSEKINDVQNRITSLSNIFLKNKQRGIIGEFTLETILKDEFGESSCLKKEFTLPSKGRIDFYIQLYDSKGIGIDSKFPIDHYQKLSNIINYQPNNDNDRLIWNKELEKTEKEFFDAVKKEIKDLNKKYIETNDLDAVIMYIPSESIFMLLCEDNRSSIFNESFKYKVYLCSPSTLNMMILFLHKSIRDFNLKKNINSIIDVIYKINSEFKTWNERYSNLEKVIDKLVNEKDQLNTTRNKINKQISRLESNVNGNPELQQN